MPLRKNTANEPLRQVVEREYPRDASGLEAQLHAPDAERRRWAARDLAEYPGSAATLGSALIQERHAGVRQALFTSLATLANDGAVIALLPLLRSEDASLRNGAIEALAAMPEAVTGRVDVLLHDADPDVRIFAVNLLGELRHTKVPAWLEQVLQRDAAINVVAAAVEVLAEVGSPEHIPALRATHRRFADDAFLGFATDLAIERIESK